MKMKDALKKLEKMGIKTINDLDNYSRQHPKSDKNGPFIESRFGTLKGLIGESAAISILHELANKQCT